MSVQARYGGQVRFVGVPGLANTDDMAAFIRNRGVGGFPHIANANELWRRFGVATQRTYVVINDDGSWRRTGYGNLEGEVTALINS